MRYEAVAHSYWRLIKIGRKTYSAVPKMLQSIVADLAKADVKDGIIAAEEYLGYIGEEYTE